MTRNLLAALLVLGFAEQSAFAQEAPDTSAVDLPTLNLAPATPSVKLAKQRQYELTLAAKLTEDEEPLSRGLVWRVFRPETVSGEKLPLIGTSKGGTAIFELEPGMIGGPYLGPKGYYIIYCESRSAPTNPLRMSEERHVQMLQEDYTRKSFQRYAHESLALTEKSGLDAVKPR